jgi:hypothetical protein
MMTVVAWAAVAQPKSAAAMSGLIMRISEPLSRIRRRKRLNAK